MAIQPLNPSQVNIGGSDLMRQTNRPYLPINNPMRPTGGPISPSQSPSINQSQGATLGPQSVRATGSGPYDPAYRQNLATYAGGLFARPNGNLSFNPTDPNSMQGNPTGGGNAPVQGSPTGLLDQALGGNPFSFTPPVNPTPGASQQPSSNYWQFWLNQFNSPFSNMRQAQQSY